MTEYWKTYWDRHLAQVSSDDPFRQVLRTQNKQPISEELFKSIAAHIVDKLNLDPEHLVLDLCCGNGLLSAELAPYCNSVVGVDFSEALIDDIGLRGAANIIGIVSDVLQIKFRAESFDRILLAAALQHFSQPQIIRLFTDLARWLKPSGLLFVTDILDSQRMWRFYDSPQREDAYFQNTGAGTPILGTWFDRPWLAKLARYAGFATVQALDQPDAFLYSHYRFDLLCQK
jgi:cyclopropane fatty-acyl-phospholipid synthase-like methyltransferase